MIKKSNNKKLPCFTSSSRVTIKAIFAFWKGQQLSFDSYIYTASQGEGHWEKRFLHIAYRRSFTSLVSDEWMKDISLFFFNLSPFYSCRLKLSNKIIYSNIFNLTREFMSRFENSIHFRMILVPWKFPFAVKGKLELKKNRPEN